MTDSTGHYHAIYPSLLSKTVLITGASEGIGSATAELFALQGCQVIIIDLIPATNTVNKIKSLATKSWSNPSIVKAPICYQCDITDLTALRATVDTILRDRPQIDILINNAASAGNAARRQTPDITPESWDQSMNVNLRHIFFLTQYILPSMRAAKKGAIVNMGSITWRIPATGLPAYTAAKAAIMGLTRTHAREFGPYGIRVNSVMPGAIATERQVREVLTDEYRAEVFAAQAFERDLMPEEVARVIVFLSSDEASAITGSSYVVDGGWCSDP